MTGAGISTSIGIPDFRGPNGVWTCQKYGKPIPKLEGLTFASASPSLTHMALVELLNNGPAQYVVSQNVDGLHRRSGIPAEHLAEVHGNCFLEKCPHCGTVYVRDFEMSTVGFQLTGRKCTAKRCRCERSTVLLSHCNMYLFAIHWLHLQTELNTPNLCTHVPMYCTSSTSERV